MADQPTDWIKDAGWYSELRKTARYGSDEAFDALLARLLSEHAREVLAQPDTLGDGGEVDERDLRLDNADLARQLSDACARRADAYDEGYDTAMQHAHHVLNRLGYLERLGEDNGNPYRIDTQPSATSERGGLDE